MQTTFAQIGVAVLLGISTFASASEEIIIDNKDATMKGSWQKSTGSTQKYKDDYRFSSSTDAAEPTASAEFRPNIPAAGKYNVDIWYTSGDNRSTTAPVVISGKSVNTFSVNEKKDGGKWVNVAKDQEFEMGNSGFVLVGNNSGATGAVVVADAIRLVQVGGDTSGYSLTFSTSTGGTLTKEPNESAFASGATVQITAVPDQGYVFNGWTGDATGLANPLSMKMSKDKKVGASFVQGGVGVVMESDEADYKGEWTEGNIKFGKPHSQAFKWNSGGKDTPKKASATFTPNIPRAGLYDIYVWYVPGANRSEASPFEISCKSGKHIVKLSQKTGGNDWVLLAPAQEFDAGKAGSVRLFNDVDEQSAVVVSDAMAFVYVGGVSGQTASK